MIITKRILLALTVMILPIPSQAYLTGNDFFVMCPSAQDGFCLGLIRGFKEGLDTASIETMLKVYKKQDLAEIDKKTLQTVSVYCPIADDISFQEVYNVSSKWLKEHPQNASLPIGMVLAGALKDNYPCNN